MCGFCGCLPCFAHFRQCRRRFLRLCGKRRNLLILFYAAAALGIGSLIYKKFNTKFLYYV